MFGPMEPHQAREYLTTRMGRALYIHLSPLTPTPARTKVKGGRRPVIVAVGGEVGGTKIGSRGGTVDVGVKVTGAETAD